MRIRSYHFLRQNIPIFKVEFVYSENTYFGNPLYETESDEPGFFDKLNAYASSADVLYVHGNNLSPFATRTGFFLDLSPLISVDSEIASEDFYPGAWQAFQWDGGIWALPYTMQVQVLVYDKNAFDAVNFPYPDQTWRMEDYTRVAEAMHTYNSKGEVELSPLTAMNPAHLLHNIIGTAYDDSALTTQPDFSNPELLSTLEAYIDYYSAYEFEEFGGYSFDEIPMSLNYPYQLSNSSGFSGGDKDWGVSLLPGDSASAHIEGFAISSGTVYPEAAFEFVSFMTHNIDVLGDSYGSSPARRSLANVEPDEDSFFSQPEFEPEIQAIIDQALEVVIPPSELLIPRFFIGHVHWLTKKEWVSRKHWKRLNFKSWTR